MMPLPNTNSPTSKGLIMVKPPTNGKEMERILSPVQSSVLEGAMKSSTKHTSNPIKETTRNPRIKSHFVDLQSAGNSA